MLVIACGFFLALPPSGNGCQLGCIDFPLTDWYLSGPFPLKSHFPSVSFRVSSHSIGRGTNSSSIPCFPFCSNRSWSCTNLLANSLFSMPIDHHVHFFALCSFPVHYVRHLFWVFLSRPLHLEENSLHCGQNSCLFVFCSTPRRNIFVNRE